MKAIIYICCFLFIGIQYSCNKNDVPKPLNLPPEVQEVIKSDNSFGLNLFKEIMSGAEEAQNVMISPLSVSLALSMTYNGAEGDTRIAMEDAMEMAGLSRSQLNDLNKKLLDALLAHDPSVILEVANSIWYRDDFTIQQSFIDLNKEYYDAEVSSLDFSDPQTKDVINQWVADKTHNKIEDIVDQISPESFMFLINAIYFKGSWRSEFDPKETFDSEFVLEDGSKIEVPMMHLKLDANTYNNDQFSAIELPYGKGNWSMFVFVPHSGSKVNDIVEDINLENWNSWMEGFTPSTDINLGLPKFTFEYEESLVEVLKSLGMGVAFSSAADFSGILEGGGLQISDVKHKTFIEVNEEGTEAAAVTSVEIELTSAGNYFYATKPFLFVIAEKSSGTILFVGSLMNPKA